jgi:hypothetical protein
MLLPLHLRKSYFRIFIYSILLIGAYSHCGHIRSQSLPEITPVKTQKKHPNEPLFKARIVANLCASGNLGPYSNVSSGLLFSHVLGGALEADLIEIQRKETKLFVGLQSRYIEGDLFNPSQIYLFVIRSPGRMQRYPVLISPNVFTQQPTSLDSLINPISIMLAIGMCKRNNDSVRRLCVAAGVRGIINDFFSCEANLIYLFKPEQFDNLTGNSILEQENQVVVSNIKKIVETSDSISESDKLIFSNLINGKTGPYRLLKIDKENAIIFSVILNVHFFEI